MISIGYEIIQIVERIKGFCFKIKIVKHYVLEDTKSAVLF